MKVFKFGGASVKDASSVLNVAEIINLYTEDLIVVVSAMGKTTNLMERLVKACYEKEVQLIEELYQEVYEQHYNIVVALGLIEDEDFITLFEYKFDELEQKINNDLSENYAYEYDQIVSFGEIISTTIISGFLNFIGIENCWFDARKIVRTDSAFRSAKVNWPKTEQLISEKIKPYLIADDEKKIAVTQGFIGHTETHQTTTLGREGSDFSAAILAWSLNAEDVTIWKDVPGMLNADPKFFNNCVKLDQISFKEAIELSYYGASVIHPKTIKPLQNKNIPLYVKSFVAPNEAGTMIQESGELDAKVPSYIFKGNQTLISFVPRDFSFVDEKGLTAFFSFFTMHNIKINLMQNSAISFSICIDDSEEVKTLILETFKNEFKVRYNSELELLTIRHYNEDVVQKLTESRVVLVQQKSRQTARFVMKKEI
ncbi:MAG: aspartate kinase [Flavobacteriales bacterium]|jgi:aspartate kinase|nr:aspartate kinase [Flavobacteriales bacterium]